MADKLDLPDIGTLGNPVSARAAINTNFTAIENAFDNTLSRDGTTPNQMEADIDLNGNDLLNVHRIDADEIYKNGVPFEQSVAYSNKLYQLFSGTGAQTNFTLQADPGSLGNLYVSVGGSDLKPGIDYNYSGTTLTFTVAPAAGTNNIYVRYDKALPTGITDSNSVSYTPPSTGALTTVKAFLDSLWSTGTNLGATLIRWIQAGTGAVARTVQDKLRDRVSVKDFGAVGDGVTDDTAAFIAASTAGGTNGFVVIPAGNYKITSSNIGDATTCWIREGNVTISGGGSTLGVHRYPHKVRFGQQPGAGDFVDMELGNANIAQITASRNTNAGNDRAGFINALVTNNNDTPTTVALMTAYHKGANTSGFPGCLATYSTAAQLNGAAVLSSFISVNSPANDLVGQAWNSGITYAQEINFGNRWGELGILKDHTTAKFVAGTVYAPDVLAGPDGGGIGYNYHAQYGVVLSAGHNGGTDRRMWIPILIATNSIPAGGIGIHTRGSNAAGSANWPLSVMEAGLNWQNGIDMSKSTFSATGRAFLGNTYSVTDLSGVEKGLLYTDGTNAIMKGPGGFYQFNTRGNFVMQNMVPPASSAATGTPGEFTFDANYAYFCVAANTWKRVALVAF